MAGLSRYGFLAKTQPEIEQELADKLRAELGPDLDLSPDGALGVIVGVMSGALSSQWQVAEQVYGANWLMSAEGAQLDHLAQLYGTRRHDPVRSEVVLQLRGDSAVMVPAGSEVELSGHKWALQRDAAPPGVGRFIAKEDGALMAAAGASWEISTPVSGWTGVRQTEDAIPGQGREQDHDLRARLAVIAQAGGGGSASGIRAAVLRLPGVTDCAVIPGGDGSAAQDRWGAGSLHVVVRGGDPKQIAQALIEATPADRRLVGRNDHTPPPPGGHPAPVVVSSGAHQWAVSFSRPVLIPVWVEIRYAALGPAIQGLHDKITAAVLRLGANVTMGQGVFPSNVLNAVYSALPGASFSDLQLRMGLSASPQTAAAVPVIRDALPVFAAERILVRPL